MDIRVWYVVEIIIKGCTAEKDAREGLLPAVIRYEHPDIPLVAWHAEKAGALLLILSGKFGLLETNTPIPLYGHKLSFEEVPEMTKKVVDKLSNLRLVNPNNKVLYFRPSDVREENHPRPYELVVVNAAKILNMECEIHNCRELY